MSSPPSKHKRRTSSFNPSSPLSESQLLPPRTPPTTALPIRTTNPITGNDDSLPPSSTSSPPLEDETQPDLPLAMSQSLLLTSPNALPTDAKTALASINSTIDPTDVKINVRFHAIGSAPQLKQKVFKISASSKFGAVVKFLGKKLGLGKGEPAIGSGGGSGATALFCYVNSVFAPGLDEGVGNLWRCFKVDEMLVVGYSITPAFG